jgi:DNA-binding NarL/FixJ family response regulator
MSHPERRRPVDHRQASGYPDVDLAMAALSSDLVGRVLELAEFERALTRLRHGQGSAIAVMGEPGIGKSRLLAELGARASQQEVVLTGSASEYERGLPFGPFIDALDEYVRALEPRHLEPLTDEVRSQLAHILPSQPARPPLPGTPAQDERYQAHRAVRLLLDRLAATKPLILLLDDLHWADSASIELLAALLRRPPTAPVLIAVGARTRQSPEFLLGAVERAARLGHLTRLDLSPLTVVESRLLLDGRFGGGDAPEWLYATSGGNPLYLEQLARTPTRSEQASTADAVHADIELPPAVAAALGEELSLIPEHVRRVLDAAAIAGDPFEPELAAAAADQPPATVLEALDELLRRDLIRQTEIPRRFRFRHPLVRRAVYEATPPAWRLGAHERCGDTLAARGAPALVIAHHVERAGRSGDPRAIAIMREAGDTAAQHAPADAARLFAAALRLLPAAGADGTAAERVDLLTALAHAQRAAGQFEAAYSTIQQALTLTSATPPEHRLRLVAACAALEQLLSRHGHARDRLMTALRELSDTPSPTAVLLMTQLAVDGFYGMQYRSMRDWARRALTAAREVDDPPLRVSAAAMLGLAAVLDGAIGEAGGACDEAAGLADTLTDEELAGCEGFVHLGVAELYLDRHREATTHTDRAWRIAQATGRDRVLPTLFWVGTIRTRHGRLGEAAETFDTAVEVARLSRHAQGVAWNLAGRSLAASAAGDTAYAVATAEEAVEAVRGGEPRFPSVLTGIAWATALLAAGDPDRAVSVLLPAAGNLGLSRVPVPWRPAAYELLTRCRLALGQHDEAVAAARHAREAAAEAPLPTTTAFADRAMAAVALAFADAATAAELATSAATAFESAGAVIDAASSRMLLAEALIHSREPGPAVVELDRTVALLADTGATGLLDEAARQLRILGPRAGRRAHPAGDGAIASLTSRELEVARLMAAGRSNRQIAAELFLSPKTVETHLRNVFHKLGVTSRLAAARIVDRHDPGPDDLPSETSAG